MLPLLVECVCVGIFVLLFVFFDRIDFFFIRLHHAIGIYLGKYWVLWFRNNWQMGSSCDSCTYRRNWANYVYVCVPYSNFIYKFNVFLFSKTKFLLFFPISSAAFDAFFRKSVPLHRWNYLKIGFRKWRHFNDDCLG